MRIDNLFGNISRVREVEKLQDNKKNNKAVADKEEANSNFVKPRFDEYVGNGGIDVLKVVTDADKAEAVENNLQYESYDVAEELSEADDISYDSIEGNEDIDGLGLAEEDEDVYDGVEENEDIGSTEETDTEHEGVEGDEGVEKNDSEVENAGEPKEAKTDNGDLDKEIEKLKKKKSRLTKEIAKAKQINNSDKVERLKKELKSVENALRKKSSEAYERLKSEIED